VLYLIILKNVIATKINVAMATKSGHKVAYHNKALCNRRTNFSEELDTIKI